ncbi:hypothetical protein GCM10010406_12850 [Streptomyces thermolineatus]|uniref:Uncharacterized protein n=1 Tax=Streptomyces thermolineatus TaxID=44033 RepID=A0ABN3L6C5_9ACTN
MVVSTDDAAAAGFRSFSGAHRAGPARPARLLPGGGNGAKTPAADAPVTARDRTARDRTARDRTAAGIPVTAPPGGRRPRRTAAGQAGRIG